MESFFDHHFGFRRVDSRWEVELDSADLIHTSDVHGYHDDLTVYRIDAHWLWLGVTLSRLNAGEEVNDENVVESFLVAALSSLSQVTFLQMEVYSDPPTPVDVLLNDSHHATDLQEWHYILRLLNDSPRFLFQKIHLLLVLT